MHASRQAFNPACKDACKNACKNARTSACMSACIEFDSVFFLYNMYGVDSVLICTGIYIYIYIYVDFFSCFVVYSVLAARLTSSGCGAG